MPDNASTSLDMGLRQAAWLTRDRATAYCRILAALMAGSAFLWTGIALARGGWDLSGTTLGADFLCFWTASRFALTGAAASSYDPALHHALERATFGGADPGYYAFLYPPICLLICLPLGLMPYFAALLAWVVTTGSAYAWVIWRVLGREKPTMLAILAYPAVLLTASHGQNSFLSTALFGGGLLLLTSRPALAGLLLGSLAFKPQLGLLIPLFLLAGGYRVTFAAACAAVTALAALSVAIFGVDTWQAFVRSLPLARMTLEQGLVEPEKLQSFFAAVRLWNGSLPTAYAAQALSALVAGVAMTVLVRRGTTPLAGGAVLVTGTLLVTPYVLDYDLTLLAIPLAWTFTQARRTGFLPYEKVALLAAFVLPLLSRSVAANFAVPLSPVVILSLFGVVCRRASIAAGAVDAVREGGGA